MVRSKAKRVALYLRVSTDEQTTEQASIRKKCGIQFRQTTAAAH